MKVHIGITTKNRAAILPKALRSVLSQTYHDKVISLFDDGSTDDTSTLKKLFPEVNWITSPESKGLIYARNLFLTENDAELFCSIDDDAWFIDSKALEIAVKYMEDDPQIAAISFDLKDHEDPDMPVIPVKSIETNMFFGGASLLRVEIVKKVGSYVLSPGNYGGEEKDLCIRMMDAGYKIISLKGLYIWHDKTKVARNISFQHRSGVCNDLIFAYRRTPLLILFPSIIIKLWKHFIFSYRFKEEPLLKPCIKGFGDFFKFIFSGKSNRKPVSVKTFRRYLKLN